LCNQLLRGDSKKRKDQTRDEVVDELLQLINQLRGQLKEHQRLIGEFKSHPSFNHTPKTLNKELLKDSDKVEI
jgi:hypothetical protein